MPMYAILKNVSPEAADSRYAVVDFADDLPGARKIQAEQESGTHLFLDNDYHELSAGCIDIMRAHMSQAGIEAPFADDGTHVLVLELLELRRRFNNGERLDLGEVSDEILCQHCQLPETHHALTTVSCEGYSPPSPHVTSEKRAVLQENTEVEE
ncbi:hypothetical protein LCGC14_1600960 [marine sediment metagenome]|uniref:Uncharacterized protein n=1 Tax=marine sediment metagenome TaxID=412755 RepID=A0A0F9LB72_9ZZZZ